ncbi:hypothetical protein PVAP13_8NG084200 [Panicum virgatum]|uniref:Uncharacterized protein n=1 Tax=Panicum virgatum TaxID=38727 RepID=A0A8T0P2P5_PANVG|nr:hypothetical protein PVAP13_8NG084200 [Panicum virgatum]
MQDPSRTMSQENDGEAAGVVVNSHGVQEQHDRGTTSGGRAGASAEEDGERGGGQEPFFQCLDDQEQPSGMVHLDDARAEFPSDDEDGGGDSDNVRCSFATAVGDGDRLLEEQAELDLDGEEEDTSRYDYGMWMSTEPASIQERRRRLLQGMGLASSRDLLRSRNARARLPPDIPRCAARRHHQQPPTAAGDAPPSATIHAPAVAAAAPPPPPPEIATRQPGAVLNRSRSDTRLAVRGGGAARKPPSLRRVYSMPHFLQAPPPANKAPRARPLPSAASKDAGIGKAGDTGGAGVTTKAQDCRTANAQINVAQRGVPLNLDEFERFIGSTPLVKQLMRRSQSQPVPTGAPAKGGEKPPEKKRTRWLRNIKLVASAAGLRSEKDKDGDGGGSRSARAAPAATMSKSASANAAVSPATGPERPKVHVHHCGKSSKELTGLYQRQEVRAHEGSIWSIKFSPDGRFLASGGEDHVVRVWEVVDADGGASAAVAQELSPASQPPQPPPPASADAGRPAAPGLAAQLSRRMRRGRSTKDALPEHIVVPESVFALAEQPACAFEGHQDDVLDLSWSKSQLLSSSMDKTVRLWDMDTKTCLKMFPHNDYVTCVQFNPVDDGYFISGSLDSKVRIWSVPGRHVVDWSDLNDMVTAGCYTPDGQLPAFQGCDHRVPQGLLPILQDNRLQAQPGGTNRHEHIEEAAVAGEEDHRIPVCAGEPVGDTGHVGGLADPGVQRHHRPPEVQREPVFLPARVQEHQQPDHRVLHRRRPLRRLRQRGLARLRVAPGSRRWRRRRRRRRGGRHRRPGQDLAHQPLLRVLLLPGRVRGRAVARVAVPAVRRGVPGRRRQERHAQEAGRRRRRRRAAAAQVRADGVPRRAPSASAVSARVVVRAVARRRGGRQRVGDGGGDGEPRRGDQGVPELRDACRQPLPLAVSDRQAD